MSDTGGAPAPNALFPVNYLKAADYREVSCDGAFGGPTPQGKLWIGFFSERYPIPRVIAFPAQPNPDDPTSMKLDETVTPAFIDSRQGLIRNVEFGAYISLEAAERLHVWLGTKIAEMQKAKS